MKDSLISLKAHERAISLEANQSPLQTLGNYLLTNIRANVAEEHNRLSVKQRLRVKFYFN